MTARKLSISQTHFTQSTGSARPIVVKNEDIPRFRSIISAPLKGLAKFSVDLGRLATLLADPGRLLGKYTEPLFEKAEEKIEERIPTRPEYLEKSLERSGRLAPAALTGGSLLAAAVSSLAGGFAGQSVEEAGGGPVLQSVAEIGPSILPGFARKIIPSSAEQKKILEMGRRFGMTEKQLAPLMPETAKKRFFGRFSFSGEKAAETLKETKSGIQNIYQILETSPQATAFLSPNELTIFSRNINHLAQRMPHNIRVQLKHDAADLVNSARQKGGVSGEDLMNFYHDISNRYNLGRQQLEIFKNPVRDALKSIDPQLAADFETVNKMYQKSIQIGRILKPGDYEHLISLGEAYELGASVANLDMPRLGRLLGLVGFRKFSEKMLTSPRLQNLIEQMQNAVAKNQLPIIKKLGDLILKEYKEKDQRE